MKKVILIQIQTFKHQILNSAKQAYTVMIHTGKTLASFLVYFS